MQVICYLVVQGKVPKFGMNRQNTREAGALRLTKTRPSTAADEISVKLDLDIPDSLFIKPSLEARISVPKGGERGPVITTDVADNIAELIRQQTGLTVHLSVDEDEADGQS